MPEIITEKWKSLQRLLGRLQEATGLIPVVIIFTGLIAHFSLEANLKSALAEDLGYTPGRGAFYISVPLAGRSEGALVENTSAPDEEPLLMESADVGYLIIEDSALLNTGNPLSANIVHRDGLMVYKVQKGDTLSGIAANFGISLNTVYWANKDIKSNSLRLGQEIVILPISGVIHQVQTGESLDTIAAVYNVPESRIVRYNARVLSRGLAAGINLIIPDGKPRESIGKTASALPSFPGYYALPTTGWNWGKLHNFNGVDIANGCGTPIYAAAEGLVSEVRSGGWNEGYGSYVIIEHPNNTRTRYAHNQRNVVSVGDYILQGDTIGYIGNTGLTHGPTGCHVHFEVMGARNPFAK